MKIRYLHLSDLHLTSIANKGPVEAFNQDMITKSLIDAAGDLQERIDFIIITGDIARSGKAEEYEVCEVFCGKLLDAAGIEPSQLFLVPGNHDIDRSVIAKRHIKRIYPFDNQDDITEIITDPDDFPILMRKFEGFNAFAENAMGDNGIGLGG